MKVSIIGLLTMLSSMVSSVSSANPSPLPVFKEQDRSHLVESYGKLPLSFEANQGQTDKSVQFLSRGAGYTLFLTPTEAVLGLSKTVKESSVKPNPKNIKSAEKHETSTVRMQLVGANASPKAAGVDELPGKVNYLHGNDKKQWRTNIATYGKVKYEQVYPGIDLVYYGNQRQLEYDFVVAPGADPNKIQLSFAGQTLKDKLVPSINSAGELVVGEVQLKKPVIYQEIGGKRKDIAGQFTLKTDNKVGFQLAAYDKSQPLVIDPVLVYSGVIGGSNYDAIADVAVDKTGRLYVVGETDSADFPMQNTPHDDPGADKFIGEAFLFVLSPDGKSLATATFIGGKGPDEASAVALDGDGNIYIVGSTWSYNADIPNRFPQTVPLGHIFYKPRDAQGNIYQAYVDTFLMKLDPSGSSIVYSMAAGGTYQDYAYGVAVDKQGNAYVTGYTSQLVPEDRFPILNALYPQTSGGGTASDGFLFKIAPNGDALFSTYFGGTEDDNPMDIAVDSNSDVYVVGGTNSVDFPTKNALYPNAGYQDVFLLKMKSNGSALLYSTYLGGADSDKAFSVAVDSDDYAYVTGYTKSLDFPIKNSLYPSGESFLLKMNPTGSALTFSTYFGGNGSTTGEDVALDASGNSYVAGITQSDNFPAINAPYPNKSGTISEYGNFLFKMNKAGTAVIYSTYLPRTNVVWFEGLHGLAVDSAGSAYVAGMTYATADITVVNGLNIPGSGISSGGFMMKISDVSHPLTITKAGSGTVTSGANEISCGAVCEVDFEEGTQVVLTASPVAGFIFVGWDGDCTGIDICTVSMGKAKKVTANFANAATLTTVKSGNGNGVITSAPSGISCGVDCSEDYAQNSQINLAAAPDVNSTFTGWSGSGCSGIGSCTVTMDAAKSVTASFTLKLVGPLLTVTKAGNGTGKVTSTPMGIDCGTACSTTYLKKTIVTLSATPDSGSTFGSWSGGCSGVAVTCKVTMTAAKTVKATFKKIPSYLLTVVKAGTGTGTVVSSPVGIDCGADCTESYLNKTVVNLTATPDTTATFTSWSGGCTGKAACKVTMTAAKKVTATFKKK